MEVIEAALALSEADRHIVVEQLVVSFDCDDEYEGADDVWSAEISRRVDDILTGAVQGIPWKQVRAEADRVAAEAR